MPLCTRTYAVELKDGEPARPTAALEELAPSSLVVVTESKVAATRGARLERAIESLAVPPTGEQSKTLATVSRIRDASASSPDLRGIRGAAPHRRSPRRIVR